MAKGISLNIGLNSVDPNHYGGWDGKLIACENDATDLAEIAKSSGFEATKVLTKDATVNNVTNNINSATQKLGSGDYFLLTYSGHGGQFKDENNDEDDFLDETWCLYDRQYVDDELNAGLRDFKPGVKIFVLSDSCHSGTVVKAAFLKGRKDMDTFNSNVDKSGIRYRFAPDAILNRTYIKNKSQYDKILGDVNLKEKEVHASVLLVSGCEDDELSADGPYNGLFTSNVLRVWDNGSFNGSHKKFHKLIYNNMLATEQHPKYFKEGKDNFAFEKSRPFTI